MKEIASFTSSYEQNLFETRYRGPGSGESSWFDVFNRVASTVANGDQALVDDFTDMMSTGLVIPSSPQLWNYGANRRFNRNGSSCFTGRMGDTLDAFRQADADAESVYVASGGFGILLDEVRPRGTYIKHCSEGAMGSMCLGGPARRVEGTTGYITGSGRARGALMMQQSIWHPDILEFMLAKQPTSLGFLDDWRENAWAVLGWNEPGAKRKVHVQFAIERFHSKWAFRKDWPHINEFVQDMDHMGYDGVSALSLMEEAGIVSIDDLGRAVPMVLDWSLGSARPANRDWELPMQNCNMSVRFPDEFMEAVENDDTWVLRWFDSDPPDDGEMPWTRTDAVTGSMLEEYTDRYFSVSEDGTEADWDMDQPPDGGAAYRYGVVITTWEGLRQNLSPNRNMWRDTDYARFVRKVIDGAIGHLTGPIMARQLWHIHNVAAHGHADPGSVFSSTYERFQPIDSDIYGPRLSNPCSEYVNSAGGSCNLASINLRLCAERAGLSEPTRPIHTRDGYILRLSRSAGFSRFIAEVDAAARRALVYIAHALEHNKAPVEYIDEMTREHYRTVGIGFMGLAEAMMMFGVTYGSKASEHLSAHVMSTIALACWEESFKLGEAGWAKPKAWNPGRMRSIFTERWANANRFALPAGHGRRWGELARKAGMGKHATHTCVTSVAPTGTISMIAGWIMTWHASNGVINERTVTSGCEPPFSWGVARQDSSGETSTFHDLWHGRFKDKPWMRTADEVPVEEHIRVQAAVCAFTCMSVSKTINMPESATVDDVKNAYMLAWKLGIPGTSIYRDRSKPMQVLSALECPSGECKVEVAPSSPQGDQPHVAK